MSFLARFLLTCTLVGITGQLPPLDFTPSPAAAASAETPSPGQPATPAPPAAAEAAPPTLWQWVEQHPRWTIVLAVIAGLVVVASIALLVGAAKAGSDPMIPKLRPSFFFWLGMMYTLLLLLMAVAYNLYFPKTSPVLLGGILPIAVPWFGALGAVTISLEGVFTWNSRWDHGYNYWHIGRPLFGAVLGIIAFFIYVVLVSAAGTPPKFFEETKPPLKDFIVYYILAFLVGYREETFRDLIRRVTDLIMKPGTPPPPAPVVTFKGPGVSPSGIAFPATPAATTARVTVSVENSGNAALTAPTLAVSPLGPTAANVFALANDRVTGAGDLPPGQARTVEVTFTPPAAGDFSATLSLAATNLSAPRTIQISGEGQ
jgi:hypothetical protein